jgi:hypothetical protein
MDTIKQFFWETNLELNINLQNIERLIFSVL